MEIYFNSTNEQKHRDVDLVFQDSARPPRHLRIAVPEVLSSDLDTVVREKAIAAYKEALVPLFVEHGGLFIDHLNGFPGPLVKLFWERLQDGLCSLIPAGASRAAHVVQKVCYCDGRTLRIYTGQVEGAIAAAKRGDGGIHWEPMFIPDGQASTLGEMPQEERLRRSASARAFAAFRAEQGI